LICPWHRTRDMEMDALYIRARCISARTLVWRGLAASNKDGSLASSPAAGTAGGSVPVSVTAVLMGPSNQQRHRRKTLLTEC